MNYLASAGVLGAMAMVVALVGLLQKANSRYGWSATLKDWLGPTLSNWVLRLGIIALAYLAAGLLEQVGLALPPEIAAFLPDQQASVMTAVVASFSYWLARQRDTDATGEGDV